MRTTSLRHYFYMLRATSSQRGNDSVVYLVCPFHIFHGIAIPLPTTRCIRLRFLLGSVSEDQGRLSCVKRLGRRHLLILPSVNLMISTKCDFRRWYSMKGRVPCLIQALCHCCPRHQIHVRWHRKKSDKRLLQSDHGKEGNARYNPSRIFLGYVSRAASMTK